MRKNKENQNKIQRHGKTKRKRKKKWTANNIWGVKHKTEPWIQKLKGEYNLFLNEWLGHKI